MIFQRADTCPDSTSPNPRLLLMQMQRDNLEQHSRRLMREIHALSRQIELELARMTQFQRTVPEYFQ